MVAVKTVVLLVLIATTAYGILNRGLFGVERWLPVAAGILGLLLFTLFSRSYYRSVPWIGWVLVGLLAGLVLVKGLSILWTISDIETVQELIRSSMYLATFVLALASITAMRQVPPLIDGAVLTAAAVAGYGLLQKINPLQYPPTTPDGVRIGSTLEYANTLAVVAGIGLVLGLGRMTRLSNPLARGFYAALLVSLGAALYFTFSRGGFLAFGVGIIVFFVLTDSRLQAFANLLLASAPLAWLVYRAQGNEALFLETVPDDRLLQAGSALRTDLLVALAVAFLLQALFALAASRYELLPAARRFLGTVAVAGVLLAAGAGVSAVVGERLFSGDLGEAVTGRVEAEGGPNARLASLSSNSRSDYWQVAWQEWKERPFTGTGAGAFMYTWMQDRPGFGGVKQVHNVYLEQGTETGVFAFLALTGFAALAAGYPALAAWRSPPQAAGNRKTLLAALSGATVVYLFSSAFEWHWYIPPSTLLFFILAAAAVKLASEPDWETPEKPGYPEREPATHGNYDRENRDRNIAG